MKELENDFIEFLRVRLTQPLPGVDAQRKMAPRFDGGKYRSFNAPDTARHSAVLALLIVSNNHASILLTLRSHLLPTHKGQLSFPGGRIEEGESYEDAALRETNEEVGIDTSHIEVLGRLSELYTPPSNSTIHPVVAYCTHFPEMNHSTGEVEESFFVSLDELAEENSIHHEEWNYNNQPMTVPLWKVHHTVPLWGATAIMLSELMALYNEWKSLK